MRNNIAASEIVQDFNRRGIKPDWIHKVNQGHLRLWRLNQRLIPELLIYSDKGESIPGTLSIRGRYSYRNTLTPQEIADDVMNESPLTKSDMAILTPAQMGQRGGAAKTEAKARAARENGKKGGRPRQAEGEGK